MGAEVTRASFVFFLAVFHSAGCQRLMLKKWGSVFTALVFVCCTLLSCSRSEELPSAELSLELLALSSDKKKYQRQCKVKKNEGYKNSPVFFVTVMQPMYLALKLDEANKVIIIEWNSTVKEMNSSVLILKSMNCGCGYTHICNVLVSTFTQLWIKFIQQEWRLWVNGLTVLC